MRNQSDSRWRVLLVDDNLCFLSSLSRILTDVAWLEVVGQAVSGKEAVEKSLTLRPDLVLMDICMPGMNGLEAATRIKAQLPASRIILMTLDESALSAAAASCPAADGFIGKVNLFTELPPLILRIFNRPQEAATDETISAKAPLLT
jgi:NarL family two-component system response regulator LiaR